MSGERQVPSHNAKPDGAPPPPAPAHVHFTAEGLRLEGDRKRTENWKRWGPYLAERQWGTVREDYSADGDCWNYLPHDHARSRAYRWGEDGLLGITDRECRLCFALALWNGKDPILKERLFGLAGPEGNHGEDVKEQYFYLDSTPTHSYMKALYKYPQAEFPYARLVEENGRRLRAQPEFELTDTGVFDQDRYFDVFAEYAKAATNDILVRITVENRAGTGATLHLIPTVWFRNTWAWGCTHDEGRWPKPRLWRDGDGVLGAEHITLGRLRIAADETPGGRRPSLLFTENETNLQRIFDVPNTSEYVKDAFHEYLVAGRTDAINPRGAGTKGAFHYTLQLPARGTATIRLRLSAEAASPSHDAPAFGPAFDQTFDKRRDEADEFYSACIPDSTSPDERRVMRQAYAGMLWSKQFYHYIVSDWLRGDPAQPPPPPRRAAGRNADWIYLYSRDVISMPDKWEYPWFAAWDLAFHVIALAKVDAQLAKDQLILFLREWYMHPNGQIPAYEFAFSDVNPPVHAWACWRVYKMTGARGVRGPGGRDREFLARAFHKLLINFTWWVNRKDPDGRHIFAGGFLGLDNIGVFDRSRPLPTGGRLEQADGTAWMAFYCGTMLSMALELASEDPAYEDVASKFFEHFVAIIDAMNTLGGTGLWNEQDGFYYDQLMLDGTSRPLQIRSMVGIIPLFAAEVLESTLTDRLPGFRHRMQWFLENRKDLARHIAYLDVQGGYGEGQKRGRQKRGQGMEGGADGTPMRRLLAVPSRERLIRALRYVLDESEFLAPHGVRSLSRVHLDHPFVVRFGDQDYRVDYTPGESTTAIFGGNSNWRGPIWFPLNYLLIEALERYHHFYGQSLRVEYPTGSGRSMDLGQVAVQLRSRLVALFLPDKSGRRACQGDDPRFARDPHWRDLLLFHEYFHGDTGRGLGASHQTGWTGLIAPILHAMRAVEAPETTVEGAVPARR